MGSHAVLCSSSEFPCLVDQGQVHVCLYLISLGTHKLHLKMKKNEKKRCSNKSKVNKIGS